MRAPRRALTLFVAAIACVLAGAIVATPRATAHAVLTSISPTDTSRLDSSPDHVSVVFSEPVQLLSGRDLGVVDSRGESVALGAGRILPDATNRAEVSLRPGLPSGTYTVRWRVVSTDGHIVPGATVFGVGDVSIGAPYLGGPGGTMGPAETSAWAVSARWLELVGVGGLLALLAFRLLVWRAVWRPAPDVAPHERDAALIWSRDTWWITFGGLALVSLVGEAYVLIVKSASALGTSVWSALGDPAGMVRVLSDTRFGDLLQIRTMALFILFALGVWRFLVEYRADAAPTPQQADGGAVAALPMLAAALVALGSISASGHASTSSLPVLQVPADALHAAAATTWVGGLALLAIWLIRLPRVAGAGGRRVGGLVLARFSGVALTLVAVIVATGIIRAFGEMGAPSDLWRTSYGWTILVKIGLLTGAGLLALRNRRVVSALRQRNGPNTATLRMVRRYATIELVISLLIIVMSSLLVAQIPPIS